MSSQHLQETSLRQSPSPGSGSEPEKHDAVYGTQSESIKPTQPPASVEASDPEYPPMTVALTILIACLCSVFLVTLDRTIISTAIPSMTRELHSATDIGWYGSAYMLANCSVQLLYGRIYKFYPAKHVFLVSIALFEAGSAICGAAPTSAVLIFGRAVSGLGAAGIMSGSMQISTHVAPLEKRPLFNGLFSVSSGVVSVIGPVLGGALTQHVSWRWCFYINLPFGAISVTAVVLLLKNYEPAGAGLSLRDKFAQLDLLGTGLFVPCIACLILALEWGGSAYAWGSWRIILLFATSGILLPSWLLVQAWKQDRATVPPMIFLQRSIAAGFVYAACATSALMIVIYYIPLWFQEVQLESAVTSGLSLLPSILALVVAATVSGLFTQRTGYFWPVMWAAPVFASFGAGLLTSLRSSSPSSEWIPYQLIFGLGIGMTQQQAMLIAQSVLPAHDVSTGIAIMLFGQQLGGALFLAVAETVFNQYLKRDLETIPVLDVTAIINSGTTNVAGEVPASVRPQVLTVYNRAIMSTLYLAVGLSCAMAIPCVCVERKNIKTEGTGSRAEKPDKREAV